MADPQKNTEFSFSIALVSRANRPQFQVNPTLATGDFKISINEGAFADLNSLPTVSPAGGSNVLISLLNSEMNGDRIVIQCKDAAGAEWDDCDITINTTLNTVDTPATIMDGSLTDSVYDRIRGNVGNSGNSPTQFSTIGLASSVNDFYKDCILKFTSGALSGQVKLVTGYNGSTKAITCMAFTGTPSYRDSFDLINF